MARLRYNALKTGSAGSGVPLALGASLTNSATSITFNAALTHSNGTAVPTITGSDYIPLEILDSSGNMTEIVWLTAYTAGATTGTITRGQEGTSGVAHSSGDKVIHGPTATDVWTKYVDNPLTSLTGFTSLTGTWGAGSGQIAQTGTSAQYNRLRYDTRTPRAMGAAEVEVKYDSGGSGATRAAGMLVAFDGVASGGSSGGLTVYLLTTDSGSTWAVRAESDGWIGLVTSAAVSYTPGTYARLSAVVTPAGVDVYFNGTYLFTAYNNDTNNTHRTADVSYIGLVTYAATATFRNLRAHGLTPPF